LVEVYGQHKNHKPTETALLFVDAIIHMAPEDILAKAKNYRDSMSGREQYMISLAEWLRTQAYLNPDIQISNNKGSAPRPESDQGRSKTELVQLERVISA
jgi:hypothetical protein